jgi:hypothetical protein
MIVRKSRSTKVAPGGAKVEQARPGGLMPTYKVTFREATGEKREETVVAASHGEALQKAGPAGPEESVEIKEDE